ncbi:MAG: restriction endonuclease subunit M/S [Deltaproteobacteria bacterium]|nr:restriction endonuclease subunit M/S [Deltaproteobacteria bacterium]MBM4322663.1 restriction endonuclease subunit M/S [Deltaproteobacteria bacterium]
MLDSETKARIDSARDILVGKVPDPKSQVEQITIALIYKFMDDMDRQSEELGGKATFFSGEYKKYAWHQLLDRRFSGHERLLLYVEGIEKMNQNKNIPQLFRDIFKGVFLPYRDPETLNLFLKEINGFTYDHSERLGDAFEYLLSILGSQGEAGQFRTPRHIIDFIVKIVDPKKNESILDPACGTAGFLISSYKHILTQHQESSSELTPDERGRLMTNFCGYDISPDMVRLSRVNLYLHGFANPRIHEYDTLTSEERWDERNDVILANPPFMTPKGGIRPHNRFSIKATRSEVLFVDYIAEHLNVNGRAGIIVPEGIIFQSQNAYKKLRKMLAENYLWCVVSLPAGCFNPYSGVKTSILLLDKSVSKRTDEILFVKVENDGFDLGAQRKPIAKNDLPEALSAISDFKLRIADLKKQDSDNQKSITAHAVKKSRILENGDINLSGDRYRDTGIRVSTKWSMVKLGDVILGPPQYGSGASKVLYNGKVRYIRITDIDDDGNLKEDDIVSPSTIEKDCYLELGDFLLARSGSVGRAYLHKRNDRIYQFAGYLIRFRLDSTKVLPTFVFFITRSLHYQTWIELMRKSGTLSNINANEYRSFEFPLPPVEVQEKIVAELDSYRKIIEGAKQIISNYKPSIKINPTWPIEELGSISNVISGQSPDGQNYNAIGEGMSFYQGKIEFGEVFLQEPKKWTTQTTKLSIKNDVLMSVRAPVGPVNINPFSQICIGRGLAAIRAGEQLDYRYLFFILNDRQEEIKRGCNGSTFDSINRSQIEEIKIPLPPLEVQRRIVEEIEVERELAEANRKLIKIYEQKIQTKLSEIWGEE